MHFVCQQQAGGVRGVGRGNVRERWGGGRGGAVGGGRGGVLTVCAHRRGAAAMLTKKPGVSVHPTGEYDPLDPLSRRQSPASVARRHRCLSNGEAKPEEGWKLSDTNTGSSVLSLLDPHIRFNLIRCRQKKLRRE